MHSGGTVNNEEDDDTMGNDNNNQYQISAFRPGAPGSSGGSMSPVCEEPKNGKQ